MTGEMTLVPCGEMDEEIRNGEIGCEEIKRNDHHFMGVMWMIRGWVRMCSACRETGSGYCWGIACSLYE